MRRNLLVLILLTVLGLGGFVFYVLKSQKPAGNQQAAGAAPEQPSTPSALPLEADAINITLTPQNDSGETGVASLVEKDGKVLVVLNVMGTPIDIEQPAHIHTGFCPNPGEVEFPLTSVLNGRSETTIDTTMANLKKMLPLAINVHKSEEEAKVYVACGDFPSN